MQQLKKSAIISIGFMMFSIFFGAGNLIFPPALGQAAGDHTLPAIMGFLLTGVGLPLTGIVAIALQGGQYTEFIEKHVHPMFALVLLGLLYLTIGPLFAIPRTGAVSFEIGIRPFLAYEDSSLGLLIYSAVFFLLTYCLALNPGKIVDRVGKILTPILLLFLAILFVRTFLAPMGDVMPAVGAYQAAPFAQGFQDGYLTMDLLASLAVGAIVVNAVKAAGVQDTRTIGRVCMIGELIAATLMSIVYLSLAYLGATSRSAFGLLDNGGVLLAKAGVYFFGSMGGIVLGVIIVFACLTTSCGMASATSWYFNKALGNRISYQRVLLFSCLFGFAAANVGLTDLIRFSVPFLTAIYPVVIVLVVLSLFSRQLVGHDSIYRWSLAFTLAFSIFDGLNAAGLQVEAVNQIFSRYIPLYALKMGWLAPAVVGAIIGYLKSCITSNYPAGRKAVD
jgi:LIVCS family branched-chain amino acid:cation transporter